jgi:hypothetical protein
MSEPGELDIEVETEPDIVELRFHALEIAAREENLAPEATLVLAAYYLKWCESGLIVPYPEPPGKAKPKKLTAVTT